MLRCRYTGKCKGFVSVTFRGSIEGIGCESVWDNIAKSMKLGGMPYFLRGC